MGNYTTDNNQKQDSPALGGVKQAVDAADYHRSLGVTKSGLLMLMKSPAHYYHWLTSEPDPSTRAMNKGTATHTLLFEPHKWNDEIAVVPPDAPDRPTKAMLEAAKPSAASQERVAWWSKFESENEGKCIINAEEEADARAMVEAVLKHEEILPLLKHKSAQAEVSISAVEEIGGLSIPCKMRCDLLTEDGKTMVDLKTAQDASQEGFSKAFMSRGYWMQAAHYIATARLAGIPVERFIFVAVESTAPYSVALYELDAKSLEKAFTIRKRLLETLVQCYATGKFPAYAKGINSLTLPPWIS
jgi:hypothetical protein